MAGPERWHFGLFKVCSRNSNGCKYDSANLWASITFSIKKREPLLFKCCMTFQCFLFFVFFFLGHIWFQSYTLTFAHMLHRQLLQEGGPFKLSSWGSFSVGGHVVPPGTAAMCQTGGEERKEGVSGQEREWGREGCRRKRKKEMEGEKQKRTGGQRRCPTVLQLSVSNTWDSLVGIMCPSVQLWQSTDND